MIEEEQEDRMISYGFRKEIDLPFDKAVETVKEELKKQGFGIMTRIDVKEKFKEKLGIDFRNYVILGACSPSHAHKAIQEEEDIGLLLPCNVVVYEQDNRMVVSIIKPTTGMGMIDNKALRQIALEVEAKLKRVFDSMK
jgi:uncharacterized protein (DUF302 family)